MLICYFDYLMKIKFCCQQMLDHVSYSLKLVTMNRYYWKIGKPACIQ
jgi:hypothetical protein